MKVKKKIYASGFKKKPQGKIHGLVLMMIALNIIELSIDDESKLGTDRLNTSNIMSRLGIVSSKQCDDFSDNDSTDDSEYEYNVLTTSQESSCRSFNIK